MLTGVHDEVEHHGVLDEAWALLQDPAHWIFELAQEGITTLAAVILLRPLLARWIARHDRKVHGR